MVSFAEEVSVLPTFRIRSNLKLAFLLSLVVLPSCGGPVQDHVDAGGVEGGQPTLPDSPSAGGATGSVRPPGKERLALGTGHGCVLDSQSKPRCWGTLELDYGQATPPDVQLSQIAGSVIANLGVLAVDGKIVLWGAVDDGAFNPGPGPYSMVSLGARAGCGIRRDGTLNCWPDTVLKQRPPEGEFVDVAVAREHACAVSVEGVIFCWGRDFENNFRAPFNGTYSQITAGELHMCALRQDGIAACWGEGAPDQPIDDNEKHYGQSTPPSSQFVQLAAGAYHTCGIHPDGTVECWGYNSKGQANAPSGTYVEVAGGLSHSCGITTGRAIKCWGSNTNDRSTPPQVDL